MMHMYCYRQPNGRTARDARRPRPRFPARAGEVKRHVDDGIGGLKLPMQP